MNKPIYILGINGSSRASAALLKNGEIVAACLEERFTRVKNQAGFPKMAIDYCLKETGIKSTDLNSVWIGFENPTLFLKEKDYQKDPVLGFLSKIKPYFTTSALKLISFLPHLYYLYELRKYTPFWALLKNRQISYVANHLNVSSQIINLVDHHHAHGFAAYYTNPSYQEIKLKKSIVLTLDGAGDQVCSRIFIIQNDNWQQIASTPNEYTIGWLYEYVTQFLGMKPNEDEYKVMGLAPYAPPQYAERVYRIFKKLMWVEGLSIKSSIPRVSYPAFLKKNLAGFRFDAIAGGIQKLTEQLTTQHIQNTIRRTGINNVVLGGGVFMNVKANMKIAQLKNVKSLWVCPSSTDDSTAIGAAYFGYKEYCTTRKIPFNPKPLKNLYLGPSYTDITHNVILNLIQDLYKQNFPFSDEKRRLRVNHGMTVKVKKLKNPAKEIAKLLAKGEIVAHFAGRMEFGARALGNRSILANPKNITVIKIINDIIKKRDFWMPFAPTILKERANEYIINPKDIDSPYMTIAFQTTERAQKELLATLHPYDFTARAQILTYEQNPKFYEIIKEFERITGIAAVLNTSFNLHGQPIICTPKDAIDSFLKSGLQFLVLEDFLIIK